MAHVARCDVLVVGAGVVGITSALALQSWGRSIILVDRREPAQETSFGNAGIIQRETIGRYGFPRDARKVLQYALNTRLEARLHYPSFPRIARILFRYWACSAPALAQKHARAMWAITDRSVAEICLAVGLVWFRFEARAFGAVWDGLMSELKPQRSAA